MAEGEVEGIEGVDMAGREEDDGVGMVMEGREERVGRVGVVRVGRSVGVEGSEGVVGMDAEVGEGRTRLARLVKGVGAGEEEVEGSREGRGDGEVRGVETVAVGLVRRVEVGEGVDCWGSPLTEGGAN